MNIGDILRTRVDEYGDVLDLVVTAILPEQVVRRMDAHGNWYITEYLSPDIRTTWRLRDE